MSRRDTIIIALLVNASLLALLFMLAVNTDDDGVADQPEMAKAISERPEAIPMQVKTVPIVFQDSHVNDEVDSFLKDLASEEKVRPVMIDDEGYVQLQPEPAVPVKQANIAKAEQPVFDGEYVEITVKRGDVLEKIARSNGTTVETIKKANNLASAKLSIGQVLRVPVKKKASQDTSTASTQKPKQSQPVAEAKPKEADKKIVASSDVQYYTIKSGDNPWKIAKQFNVRFEDLLKMNNLDEESARNMKIGDKIRVK